jgi:hypothetical protein
MSDRLTFDGLEFRLRRRLLDPQVRARLMRLDNCQARVEYEPVGGRARVDVDPYLVGIISGTVHELLHIERHAELEAWGDFEETVANAIEAEMWRRIYDSPRRLRWWRANTAFRLGRRGSA